MKKTVFIIFTALALWALPTGCNKPDAPSPEPEEQEEQKEPEVLQDLKLTVVVEGDCIFSGKPTYIMQVENPNGKEVEASILVRISSDLKKTVATIERKEMIPAHGTKDVTITTQENLDPGFYRASSFVDSKAFYHFNFGIDPFQIVSAPDKQPDFDEFWETKVLFSKT